MSDEFWERVVSLALALFDPESLSPGDCGHVLLCRVGEEMTAETTGFDPGRGWRVSIDRGETWQHWPEGEVFDPYDARKVYSALIGAGLPVRPHENAQEEVGRIAAALSEAP